jgi:iron complex transport system ATP-binding protein
MNPERDAETLLSADSLTWGLEGRTLGGPWTATLRAGETIAVLGPNGAGKTTLFRTLTGTLRARSGRIAWRGAPAATLSAAELATCVAFVPQQAASGLELSVENYTLLGRVARKGWLSRPGSDDRVIVAEALDRLGLRSLARRPLGQISGGERQLAGIARALAQQAAVLILDEPAASLDLANQERVLEQIGALTGSGLAVLFSTHQPEHAQRLATQVLALDGRGPGHYGAPEAVLTGAVLSGLYGVPVTRHEVAGRVVFAVGAR